MTYIRDDQGSLKVSIVLVFSSSIPSYFITNTANKHYYDFASYSECEAF